MKCNIIYKDLGIGRMATFDETQIAKCKLCKYASKNVHHYIRMGFCQFHKVEIFDLYKDKRNDLYSEDEHKAVITENLKFPSVVQMGKNLGEAVAKQVKAKMPMRNDLEAAKCMAICEGCEFFEHKARRCYKCGCRMSIKVKWATTKCPLGKW